MARFATLYDCLARIWGMPRPQAKLHAYRVAMGIATGPHVEADRALLNWLLNGKVSL